MAGSLIKIDEEIVTSTVASVTLTGIDSTFDVYMVKINGLSPDTAENLECRVTESGTANSTSNYDFAGKGLKTSGTFENNSGTNATQWDISDSFINATTEKNFNAIIYIFNANNSSEYTFITFETSHFAGSELYGNQGGAVFTSASSVDGLLFQIDASNNIDAGQFVLYGLNK
tara:strand:- start:575 stop:1093 length:519 start_codon:yes stop_codon:yes gene_type:complete